MAGKIGKNRETRRIDHTPVRRHGASTGAGEGTGVTAPPVPPTVPAPTGLNLVAVLSFAVGQGSARINATWVGDETYASETYALQLATDAGFTTLIGTFNTPPNQASASVDGIPLNTTVYGRVRTIVGASASDWSATDSVTTPAADTVAPAVPTSVAASFMNAGDLSVTWVNPTSPNFRAVEIKIYASNGGALLAPPVLDASGSFVWTAAQNLTATGQVGDPSLYVELRSVNWYAAYSAVVSASATKAVPANVSGLTTSWAGDTGAAGPDCLISWTGATDANKWDLLINGHLYIRTVPFFLYTLDNNRADHAGVPDPSLGLSIRAQDGLKQYSASSTTLTATNAAPAAPTVTLTGGFSLLIGQVTSARAADFLAYEYQWLRDTVVQRTLESAASEQQYELGAVGDEGAHSWQVKVRQKDVFGQFSSVTNSSTVVVDALTIAMLRSGAMYSDIDLNANAVLAALKDNIRGSGGIAYNP